MTRKQALIKALEIIELSQNTVEKELIIKHLKDVINKDCNTKWTEDNIFSAINEWIGIHNKVPIHKDFQKRGLPKPITVERIFNMKLKDFLIKYYPADCENNHNEKCNNKYNYMSKLEWTNNFIEQYNKIKPLTARQYNAKRDMNTPTWNTISRYCSDGTWTGLILETNVNTDFLYKKVVYKKQELSVNNSDLDIYTYYNSKIKNSSLKIAK